MIRKVRYIKLGESNSYTERCLNNDEIILGFETGKEEMLNACKANDWGKAEEIYNRDRNLSKSELKNTMRQIKDFFGFERPTVSGLNEMECFGDKFNGELSRTFAAFRSDAPANTSHIKGP